MTRAKSKTEAGRLKKWVLLINFFFIILLVLTYITPFVPVEKWGFLSLLALAYPFTMLINGFFALGWFFFRNWFPLFSLVAILAGFSIHTRYIKIVSFGNEKAECKESIRLMAYNLRGLSMVTVKEGQGLEGKIDSIHSALKDLEEFPDILCLQETAGGELIAKKFGLPYTYHAPKSSLWMLSRYPIVKRGQLDGEEKSPSCMWADIKTNQGILRVYNMHLVSNRVTHTTEELIEDLNLKNENTWNKVRFILSRYIHTTKKRGIEARALRKHISQSPYPAVIAGDVNDTPLSHAFHLLADGLKDSFKERGSGLSTTYQSTLPLLRIDYLLGTDGIYFKDHTTHHIRYSDHYPVSTGICIQIPAGS